jgi:hypothetical protein
MMSNTVLKDSNRYLSSCGWEISLPTGWHALTMEGDEAAVASDVIVFCCKEQPEQTFSWMVRPQAATKDIASKFVCLSMLEGPVGLNEITELLPSIFPAIGNIYSARIVEGKDGNRALEVYETYEQGDEQKKGFQHISLARKYGKIFFQRIAFYAQADIFESLIANICQSAQSFEYSAATSASE